MTQDNYRKVKLLKLLELLRTETDEIHPMTTAQICVRLTDMGIVCDRRTLSKDISLLNELGYEILSFMDGHNKAYYVEDRVFSTPELKALIDAVQASGFITQKKTDELIAKIAELGGIHKARQLQNSLVHFNTRKHSNEGIFYSIDCLENAIQKNKKVIFLYFDLDEKGNRVYRRDGHHYVVDPVALVFSEDNYYLIAYSSRHGNTTNYRVDRMDRVEMIEESISDSVPALRGTIGEYTEQVFRMFNGDPVEVTLSFTPTLLGSIFDKFGENVSIQKDKDGSCVVKVNVQLSPTFYGWLFQFSTQIKIISPQSVASTYQKQLKEVFLTYSQTEQQPESEDDLK